MKPQLVLTLIGASLGGLLAGLAYLIQPALFTKLAMPQGSKFESLEDLRSSIQHRSESETSTDTEVPLRGIVIPNPSDKIIYELEPNRTARFRGQMVTMNSFGMRSPEIAKEKPANTKRVAVLGDSYAFGWGVEQNAPFSRWLEGELTKVAPAGQRVEVLNFGVPGYATFQEVALFFEKAATFSPDAVLVYFIKNDFGLPFFIKDLHNESSLLPAPEFNQQKIAPDDKEGQEKRRALLQSLDPNRALGELAMYCKEKNMALFLAPHPDESATKMRGKLWILKKGEPARAIKYLDITSQYRAIIERDQISEASLSIPRDHHPGPGAHQAIGKALAPFIAPSLWPQPAA